MFSTSVYSVCLSKFRFSKCCLSILQKNIGVSIVLHNQSIGYIDKNWIELNDISQNPCNLNIDMFYNGLEVN